MKTVKFSVVSPSVDPWKKPSKWKPLADTLKSGKIVHFPLLPSGYSRTCSTLHCALRPLGVLVTTKANGTGIYVKVRK